MNELPPIIEPQVSSPPATSLVARLLNVFAIPGDVFEEVRTSRSTAVNWIVPALLSGIVAAIASILVASQQDLVQKNREQHEARLEQLVKDGKMSRSDAENAKNWMGKMYEPAVLKSFGAVVGMSVGVVRVLWWGCVLWFLARIFLRTKVGFGKSLEAAGLAGMIGVLGIAVTMLLQSKLDHSAEVAKEFDPKNSLHLTLLALKIFDVWQAGVLASALARLAGVPFIRGAFVMFPFWLLWLTAMTLVGSVLLQFAG